MSKQVAETLEKARMLMNGGGKHWSRGDYIKHKAGVDGLCYCAFAAVQTAAGVKANELHAIEFLVAALPKAYKEGFSPTECIIVYNDSKHRRWKHIDALFKRAIKLALDADSAAV